MKPMERRRSELLADAAAQAAAAARDFNIPDDVAEQIGATIADALADNWGGQVITFPKDYAYKLSQRDRTILELHRTGTPLGQLARDFSMTERGLRKLLRRAESRDRDLRQQQLFLVES